MIVVLLLSGSVVDCLDELRWDCASLGFATAKVKWRSSIPQTKHLWFAQRQLDNPVSTNLLVSLILSLKNHSHACVFTSRIAATISVMRFIRQSDMTAVFSRSFPDRYDKKPPNGTRRNKKMIPISACQPMKYHNNGTATQTSKMATRRRKNCLAACSILWTSLDTRSITWPFVNSLSVCWPRSRIYRKQQSCQIDQIFGSYSYN